MVSPAVASRLPSGLQATVSIVPLHPINYRTEAASSLPVLAEKSLTRPTVRRGFSGYLMSRSPTARTLPSGLQASERGSPRSGAAGERPLLSSHRRSSTVHAGGSTQALVANRFPSGLQLARRSQPMLCCPESITFAGLDVEDPRYLILCTDQQTLSIRAERDPAARGPHPVAQMVMAFGATCVSQTLIVRRQGIVAARSSPLGLHASCHGALQMGWNRPESDSTCRVPDLDRTAPGRRRQPISAWAPRGPSLLPLPDPATVQPPCRSSGP